MQIFLCVFTEGSREALNAVVATVPGSGTPMENETSAQNTFNFLSDEGLLIYLVLGHVNSAINLKQNPNI